MDEKPLYFKALKLECVWTSAGINAFFRILSTACLDHTYRRLSSSVKRISPVSPVRRAL